MAELLKNRFNAELVNRLATEIKKEYPEFQTRKFNSDVLDDNWQERELKQRMRHISTVLAEHLPDDYRNALAILKPVAENFDDLEALIFPDFIELNGLHDYDASVPAMAHFTQFCSSEFPVRFFIKKYPEKMMQQMFAWADSDNHHVRRLASEGCRPRLPWAIVLPDFKKNPELILPILEKLKNDESEYVRRSVANNLNDISKDNPDIVLDIAENWFGENENIDRLLKHALRTLLKSGDAKAMKMFGYTPLKNLVIEDLTLTKQVKWGSELKFSFSLNSKKRLGKLRVEYVIEFLRANGQYSRKVFKLSEGEVDSYCKNWKKIHSFKPISTRKYYPGLQYLNIIINGKQVASSSFMLDPKD